MQLDGLDLMRLVGGRDRGGDRVDQDLVGQRVPQQHGVVVEVLVERDAQQQHDEDEGQRRDDRDVAQTGEDLARIIPAGEQHG